MPSDREPGLIAAEDAGRASAEAYDAEAAATGWLGPQVAFGLAYEYVEPGQTVLDLGIGTGLGSLLFRKAGLHVHGMDISQEMLDACRWKGFANLTLHDLTKPPYPYASRSFDHAVCLGVLPFFSDPSPVFAEATRVTKSGGLFIFLTLARGHDETPELLVGPDHTGTGEPATLYRHSREQITALLQSLGLSLLRTLPVPVYMDAERAARMQAECYLARQGEPAVPATHS